MKDYILNSFENHILEWHHLQFCEFCLRNLDNCADYRLQIAISVALNHLWFHLYLYDTQVACESTRHGLIGSEFEMRMQKKNRSTTSNRLGSTGMSLSSV